MHIPRIVLVVALLTVLVLLVTASVHGLPLLQAPQVPHPLEGRDNCLLCHDTGNVKPFPADHAGRDVSICLGCHQPGVIAGSTRPTPIAAEPVTSSTSGAAEVQIEQGTPETQGALPLIPHTLKGRDNCLLCHDAGGAKPFPADHAGRDKDTCLNCHEPEMSAGAAGPTPTTAGAALVPTAPLTEFVPTPIQEPVMFDENNCISCHEGLGGASAQIAADWQASLHSERGVGCVSCHGGDPTKAGAGEAMSKEAGFLGPLPKQQIPPLCGSCHSRVDLMRQFDLPTDQLSQYWQSKHGQALLDGDQNVATCFDCHDGHRVLAIDDPSSQVYPTNESAMCAICHADTEMMSQYGIPADPYALYEESVHGIALLQNHDLRAPTCSTCHGKHGAAPPGFKEVANVCGQCHAVTEDYYLQGAHRIGVTTEEAPRCVTCHGLHDVQHATRDLFLGAEPGRCNSCHEPGTDTGDKVDVIYGNLLEADESYEHAEAIVEKAKEERLIMAIQEEQLQKAKSPLIEAQALQHTVDPAQVQEKTAESVQISEQVLASAEAALKDIDLRRLGMIAAVFFILLTVVALILIKRQLDRDLDAKRARQRHDS